MIETTATSVTTARAGTVPAPSGPRARKEGLMASLTTSPVTLDIEGLDFQIVADLEVGVVYPLTVCCSASAKGSADGVVCRACYQQVSPNLGMGWSLAEAADALFCGTCGDLHHHCPHSPLHGLGTEEREA